MSRKRQRETIPPSDNGVATLDLPAVAAPAPVQLVRLDLGCGANKQPGFTGADSVGFPGVDVVTDLRQPWPWPDNSVSEVFCSHFLEHLTAAERVHFANELYRVLVPGRYEGGQPVAGFARIITPHWASARAYGDPTHQWPPVSEWAFFYWNRDWRLGIPDKNQPGNAPHTDIAHNPNGFRCDFDWTTGGSFHPALLTRSEDYKQHAIQWFKEAFQDTIATMVKKG